MNRAYCAAARVAVAEDEVISRSKTAPAVLDNKQAAATSKTVQVDTTAAPSSAVARLPVCDDV